MLSCTGVDLGKTGTREVSVGILWGGPRAGNGGFRRRVSVASDLLTFRRLSLPPASREVRRRVVQEELNFSLPFPVSQAAWDWTDDQGEAWVVVAPLERLEPVRREAGESSEFDAEPLSYLRAAQAAGIHSALVLDLGASRTTFCAVENGRVDWVRVLLRGGIALTARLAEEKDLTTEKAEILKRAQGLELDTCIRFFEELLDEAFLPDPMAYEKILLCGGGAALPGLAPVLARRLGIEPEFFPVPEPLTPFEHVAAYGAALGIRPAYPRIRLRRQEVVERTVGFRWSYVFVLLLLVGLIVADVEIRHRTLLERKQALERVATQALDPVLGPSDQPVDARVKQLKKRIEEDRHARTYSPANVIQSLAGLAAPLRANEGVQLRSVEINEDQNTVSIEGHAVAPQQVEQLRKSLDGKVFEELKAINVRSGPEEKFLYELEGKLKPL
ncbi:MAG: pilus assembly protein PilM [Armatimonadetes bacterium]|nr:pilus assembly protein PilM [Armatimonadota bacterium]